MSERSRKIFIVGTGTDVGKTYVAGLMVKKLKESGRSAGYYKAAMSGNERGEDGDLLPGDALYVKKISGIEQSLDQMCPYVYEHGVSPHLASRLEGNPVRMDVVEKGFWEVCARYDYVTMEGSGGILCPVCFDQEDMAGGCDPQTWSVLPSGCPCRSWHHQQCGPDRGIYARPGHSCQRYCL
jgi:dethiobiotin synthetase